MTVYKSQCTLVEERNIVYRLDHQGVGVGTPIALVRIIATVQLTNHILIFFTRPARFRQE